MKTSLPRIILPAIVMLAASFLTGCALTEGKAHIAYAPHQGVTKIAGAEALPVHPVIHDERSSKNKVSCKKNGYGMEMAAIRADADVAQVLKNAVESELANRGFPIKTNGVTIAVTISKFYSDFKIGFWSGTAAAEAVMEVQVKDVTNNLVYSKLINGEGIEDNCMLASGTNAEKALNASLQDAMTRLFDDKNFIEALFKAGKTP